MEISEAELGSRSQVGRICVRPSLRKGDGGEVDAEEAGPGASNDFDAVATSATPEIDEDGANVNDECCNDVVDRRPRQVAGRL